MNWMLRLYPAPWRRRYGEEFGAVLDGQRASFGLILDVISGAVDAHLHPQIRKSEIKGDDRMTLDMLQRCAAGGPKLSAPDRKVASTFMILSALVIAALYMALTKIYHSAPAVEALFFTSFPFLSLVYGQAAYLRKRPWLTQALVLGSGLAAIYLVMLSACVIGSKL